MVYRSNGKVVPNMAQCNLKYCPKCSKEKNIIDFSINRRARDGRYYCCKDCKFLHNQKTRGPRNKKQLDWLKNNSAKAEIKRLERRQKRLDLVWSLKNKPCQDCGLQFHPYCMDFDHREDSIKFKDISQINREDEIVEEAKKCDVVCSNCHRLRTFKRYDVKFKDRKAYLESIIKEKNE